MITQVFPNDNFRSSEVYYTKLHQSSETFQCTILSEETLRKYKGFHTDDENALEVRVKPAVEVPGDFRLKVEDTSKVIELYARREAVMNKHISTLCKSTKSVLPLETFQGPDPEVVKIIDGGPQSNRIDVVFMGDGYTASARQQFFDDINRLTKDMFEGVTFRSFLPLFNIWAIYVESVDSGIGYNGAKNTPFKLYREEGQLRAIYTGAAGNARTICSLTGSSGCDYPSLIGNDDFYGGLGGEFVISTKSNRTGKSSISIIKDQIRNDKSNILDFIISGTIVLRHEMGHNFADVGEEYDGGSVYSGVNAGTNVNNLGWASWLSGPAKEQRAMYRLLEYVWEDLSIRDVELSFNSDGAYSSWYMVISVTAAGEEDCLEFILDGEVLPWTSSRSDDREFYDWYGTEGFSNGRHTLVIRSKTPSTNPDIPRMVASVDLHEFGSSEEFVQDNSYISAYPTWNWLNRKSYRPTNAGCLMRNMTHNEFCPVCREGIWSQFLRRVSLIDGLEFDPIGNPDSPRGVKVNTLGLGQLRAPGNEVDGEVLEVRWTRNGQEQEAFRDQFYINAEPGTWTVEVRLETPEIRDDPLGLLVESESFTV